MSQNLFRGVLIMSSAEKTTSPMQNCCGGSKGSFDRAGFMQTIQEMCTSNSERENASGCCAKMQQMVSGETDAATKQQE
jgi:hypothetical protein